MARFFDLLTIPEINKIMALGRRPPILRPERELSECLQCPVCLEVKGDAMVHHLDCSNLYCCECAVEIVSQRQDCGLCRRPTKDANPLGPTRFHKLLPVVRSAMDAIKYECDSCHEKMSYEKAIRHDRDCQQQEGRHVPPPHIPRREGRFERFEIISNPVPRMNAFNPTRLIQVHINGVQSITQMRKKYETAATIKQILEHKNNIPVNTITLYKFMHREIPDDEIVDNFATNRGMTWITAVTRAEFGDLANCSGVLNFQEVGQRPRIPRPPNNPAEVRAVDWGELIQWENQNI